MDSKPSGKTGIPLYLLGGFLGSGKTSLLNSILSLYEGQNTGVIINEFGDLGIDSSLIPHDSGIKVSELNGGQIFCSCLSGSFIESIKAYKNADIQALLVEASGLAKPASLREIITLAGKTGDDFFDYRGMICVVDAERFEILDETLLTIGEQITYSDSILINKTDLVDENTVERIKLRINELKPGLNIKTTAFGKIDREFLEAVGEKGSVLFDEQVNSREERRKWSGWGTPGRPIPVTLFPDLPVSRNLLEQFIKKTASMTFRMKCFIPGENGSALKVDCTGSSISVEEFDNTILADKDGLVILVPGDSDLPGRVAAIWEDSTGIPVKIEK